MTTETIPGTRRSPMPASLRRAVERVEDDPRLDAAARRLDHLSAPIASRPAVESALRGHWLGHALHPPLTDVPLGMLMSAITLDLVGGESSRRAPLCWSAGGSRRPSRPRPRGWPTGGTPAGGPAAPASPMRS